MADKKQEKASPEDVGDAGTPGEAAPVKNKKMLIPVIAVVVLVLLGGLGWFFLKPPAKSAEAATEESKAAAENDKAENDKKEPAKGEDDKNADNKGNFYDLGEIVVNLNPDGSRRQVLLQLMVQLELENSADRAALNAVKPRIIDNFQTYLRELRLDDLRGSAGLYRLREELRFRVSEAAYPVKIKDVLFQRMLIQ